MFKKRRTAFIFMHNTTGVMQRVARVCLQPPSPVGFRACAGVVTRWRGCTWTHCRWRTTTDAWSMIRASASYERTSTSGTYTWVGHVARGLCVGRTASDGAQAHSILAPAHAQPIFEELGQQFLNMQPTNSVCLVSKKLANRFTAVDARRGETCKFAVLWTSEC